MDKKIAGLVWAAVAALHSVGAANATRTPPIQPSVALRARPTRTC